MGYQMPTTIADTLLRIQKRDLILPAIQREYIWKPSQVIALFDSIMRGYPIGSFLSWKVEPDTVKKFRFYGFLKDYSQYDNRHNPTLDMLPGQEATAVLDGQQRLTSLNIGLRGSYAYRIPRTWRNNPENYPARTLHLNILGRAPENEAGLEYDFQFLSARQVEAAREDSSRYWFPVHRIFETPAVSKVWQLAREADLGDNGTAAEMLTNLWEAVHSTTAVYFYEETDQSIERVLDIFTRVNSAGTTLSYSDLLLSIATAQWRERDARSAVHGLVDELNATGQGFSFSKDVVLKSSLVLANISDIGFRVRNFTADNTAILDREWDSISDSLKVASGLLTDFGLSSASLTADSVLIPVAYYVHYRGLTTKYRENPSERDDRARLKSWVLRSLVIPGVWGSGLDSLLRDLRQAIRSHGGDAFPVEQIESRMAARGKSLTIRDELIEDLLDLSYGKPRTFVALAVLFPHVNTRNLHHVDHIFPRSLLTKTTLRRLGYEAEELEKVLGMRDKLPNLQLIEGQENLTKSAAVPSEWVQAAYSSEDTREAYLRANDISSLPADVGEFEEFFAQRRQALARRFKQIFAITELGEDARTATREETTSDIPKSPDEAMSEAEVATEEG